MVVAYLYLCETILLTSKHETNVISYPTCKTSAVGNKKRTELKIARYLTQGSHSVCRYSGVL